ncbi:MAG TPA: hypothetical protein VGN23_10500 [Verrucomicrobiae bacterium]
MSQSANSDKTNSTVAISIGVVVLGIFLAGILALGYVVVKQTAQRKALAQLKETNPVEYYVLHTPAVPDDDTLKNEMVGTWKLTGARSRRTHDFVFLSPDNYYFKTFTLTNWSIATYDGQSNLVYSAGGPYKLAGDNYTEIIQSATGMMKQYLRAQPTFRIRVDGDTYYQMGAGRNPTIEEMWQRVQE